MKKLSFYHLPFFFILFLTSCKDNPVQLTQEPAYKEVVALLYQSGTNPPIVTLINNELNVTITSIRVDTGLYTLVSDSPVFTTYKTITFINNSVLGNISAFQSSRYTISIETKNENSNYSDNILIENSITIRVYK